MNPPNKMELFGLIISPLGLPGMAIPLFTSGKKLYTQDTGRNGLVSRFVETTLDSRVDLIPIKRGQFSLLVGDEPIYAVALDRRSIVLGTERELAAKLNFKDPRLEKHPELRADLAEFVQNKDALDQALAAIERKNESEREGMHSRPFRNNQNELVRWILKGPGRRRIYEALREYVPANVISKFTPANIGIRLLEVKVKSIKVKVTVVEGGVRESFTARVSKINAEHLVSILAVESGIRKRAGLLNRTKIRFRSSHGTRLVSRVKMRQLRSRKSKLVHESV